MPSSTSSLADERSDVHTEISGMAVTTVHVHERALVESDFIGAGTRVWAFAHVMRGAQIGTDCNICDHTFVEGDVIVGDRVTIKSGVYLWDGLRIEDDVFIGPQATFTNDPFPRSKASFYRPITAVRRGASIGAGAIILPGVTIGERAMVGAGAVVTKDVANDAVVVGNPARVIRMLDQPGPCSQAP
jgi:UDP-2-acetamido-3-amino-2,3-dideoxy-glucuronate N-acetyltransferase